MSEDPDECLLSDFLREPGIANDPDRKSEQPVLVAAHEDNTGPVVTERDARKQRFI